MVAASLARRASTAAQMGRGTSWYSLVVSVLLLFASSSTTVCLADLSPFEAGALSNFISELDTQTYTYPWTSSLTEAVSACNFPVWRGLNCTLLESGYHTITSISANSLGGRLSPSIGQLANLTSISLLKSQMTGTIPTELGDLVNLQYLRIVSQRSRPASSLTGPIPATLENLQALRVLDLSSNSLSGTIPRGILNLPYLSRLDLSVNMLTGSDLNLSNLTLLQSLDIRLNAFTGPLPILPEGASLSYLDLSLNRFHGGIPPKYFENTQLLLFRVSQNSLSGPFPAGFAAATALRVLDLSFNHFYGPVIIEAGQFTSLADLNLESNKFNGTLPSEIGQILQLESFSIGDNLFRGAVPSWLQSLVYLSTLGLHANSFEGEIPSFLGAMSSLRNLYLDRNNFTGALPTTFATANNLFVLDVSSNRIDCPSFTIPNEIEHCDFHSNFMCDEAPTQLYNPSCATIPLRCRVTPCASRSSNIEILSGGCSGERVLVESKPRIVYDTCKPKFDIIFDLAPGRASLFRLAVDAITDSILKVGDYAVYNSTDVTWTIYTESFSSTNNPNVSSLVYKGELANGAQVTIPFFFFQQPDEVRIFDQNVAIFQNTLKFSFDITRWRGQVDAYHDKDEDTDHAVGFLMNVETSEGVEPGNLLSIAERLELNNVNDTSDWILNFQYLETTTNMSMRIATNGQSDRRMELRTRGQLASRSPINLAMKILLPMISSVSYDPDFAVLFGSGVDSEPTVPGEEFPYAAVIVPVMFAVVIACAAFTYWRWRTANSAKKETKDRIKEYQLKETSGLATPPDSPSWVGAQRETARLTNVKR